VSRHISGIETVFSQGGPAVLARAAFLPSLPQAVSKLLEATYDDESSMAYIAEIAGKDPALTAEILRLAHSPLFGSRRRVATLSQATVILGLHTVQNIAVSLSVYGAFSDLADVPGFSLGTFWWHSLASAACSRFLALRAGYESPEEAFVAGLLHDVGQLVLIRQAPGDYAKAFQAASNGQTLIAAEREIWGYDHAQVGADLLEYWRLQPLLCDAVRFHHHPVSEVSSALHLVRIVFVADRLSHFLSRPYATNWTDLQTFALDLLEIAPETLDELQQSILSEVEAVASLLGIQVQPPEAATIPEILPDENRSRGELRARALDLSLVLGGVQAVLSARDEEELHEAFLRSLGILFDFRHVFLGRISRPGILAGLKALGSREDRLAPQIHLPCSPGSIWDEAFVRKDVLHYDEFFQDKGPRVIDRQTATFLGGPYLVIPLAWRDERVGAVAVAMPASEWTQRKASRELLLLMARQMAQIMLGHRYRQLFAREHTINIAVLESAPVGILLVDGHGAASYWNPAGRNILGQSWAQSAPKEFNLWECLGLDTVTRDKILNDTEQGRTSEFEELRWTSPAGHTRWLRVKTVPVKMPEASRLLVVVEDVTFAHLLEEERRQRAGWLQRQLEERTEELKLAQQKVIQAERLGATGDFARRVVHEVNNPLGIIKNFLKLLQLPDTGGEVRGEAIEAIHGEIDRIAEIIRGLADFGGSHAEASHTEGGYIQRVMKDLESLMKDPLGKKGIALVAEIEADLPPVRLSDHSLKQVFINLFKNAEEALGAGPGRILVRAYRQESCPHTVCVDIADSGPGVPQAVRCRLFDPFVTTKGGENSGLGLSVCHGLIKAAGGTIELEDKEGWGAFFEIRLPCFGEEAPSFSSKAGAGPTEE